MDNPAILAIDPGPQRSAYVVWDGEKVTEKGKVDNAEMLLTAGRAGYFCDRLVIEKIASYGMAVGAEVFDTCYWSGRFAQAWLHSGLGEASIDRIPRGEVKIHLCRSARAKDANVRQALIDRLGPPGKKSAPGPTFGISADVWAALAVGVTAYDRLKCGVL